MSPIPLGILAASGGAASARTLISSGGISTGTHLVLTSIPQTFKHLELMFHGNVYNHGDRLGFGTNGTQTFNWYTISRTYSGGTDGTTSRTVTNQTYFLESPTGNFSVSPGRRNTTRILIPNYTETTNTKSIYAFQEGDVISGTHGGGHFIGVATTGGAIDALRTSTSFATPFQGNWQLFGWS